MNETAKSISSAAVLEAPQKAVSSQGVSPAPLSPELLQKMDAWWRAANYLNIGQIYLMANPLVKEPLKAEHIKPRLLGHWGTSPGLNLIYVHLNRLINKYDLDVIYMAGPGHGGPALVANVYLEGTYTEYFSQHHSERARNAQAVSSVFYSGRHSQPCQRANSGFNPRGRRIRLCACACVRSSFR